MTTPSFFMMTRIGVVTHLMEHLFADRAGSPTTSRLVLIFKAAATGDREQFEAVLLEHVPDDEEGQEIVRAWCEHIVFAEIKRRELEKKATKKTDRPHPWHTWHKEIRIVLELLLGPPEGVPSAL